MAKSSREIIILACSLCKRQNYTTTKNQTKSKEKLVLKKFCKFCRKVTEHREVKVG